MKYLLGELTDVLQVVSYLEFIIKAASWSVFYRYFVQLEQGSLEELSLKEKEKA